MNEVFHGAVRKLWWIKRVQILEEKTLHLLR